MKSEISCLLIIPALLIAIFAIPIQANSFYSINSRNIDLYGEHEFSLFGVSSTGITNPNNLVTNTTGDEVIVCPVGFKLTGDVCGDCADGYYREGSANCRSCGFDYSDFIELVLMIVAASLYFIGIGVLIMRLRDRTLGCTVGWIAFIQQIIAVINNGASTLNTGTGWTASLLALIIRVLSIVNFNVQFLKPGCRIARFSFPVVYFATICFFMITGLFFLLAAWIYSRRLTREQLAGRSRNYIFQNRGKHSLLILGCLAYLQFCLRSFQGLVCRHLSKWDPATYLVIDPNTQCWTGEHVWVFTFILIFMPLYGIWYPFWCLHILRKLWKPYLKQRAEQRAKELQLQNELGSLAPENTKTNIADLLNEPHINRRAQLLDFSYDFMDEDLIDAEEELERQEMERIWADALADTNDNNNNRMLEQSPEPDSAEVINSIIDINNLQQSQQTNENGIEMQSINTNPTDTSINNSQNINNIENNDKETRSVTIQEPEKPPIDALSIRDSMIQALRSNYNKLNSIETAIHERDNGNDLVSPAIVDIDDDEKNVTDQTKQSILQKLQDKAKTFNNNNYNDINNNNNNNDNKMEITFTPAEQPGSLVSTGSSNIVSTNSRPDLKFDSNHLDAEADANIELNSYSIGKSLRLMIAEAAIPIIKTKPVEIPKDVDYAPADPNNSIITMVSKPTINNMDTISSLHAIHNFKQELKHNLDANNNQNDEENNNDNDNNNNESEIKINPLSRTNRSHSRSAFNFRNARSGFIERTTRDTDVEKFAYLYRGTRPSVYWFRNMDFLTNFTLALQISLAHNAAVQLFFAGLIFTIYFLSAGCLWPYKSTFENYTAMLRGISNTLQILFYLSLVPNAGDVKYLLFSIIIICLLVATCIILVIRIQTIREKATNFLSNKPIPFGSKIANIINKFGELTPTNISKAAIERRNSFQKEQENRINNMQTIQE